MMPWTFGGLASVYRLLKAHDLITSPAYIVMKAADEFKDKTTAPNQLWQTDFTYLKVTGWGWFYLSRVLDDFSRFIIAWKLCTTMKARDVTDTPAEPGWWIAGRWSSTAVVSRCNAFAISVGK
jgi:transposase InsO family protein